MNNLSIAQKISVGFGVIYFLVGVLGFVPGVTIMPSMTGNTMAGNGDILGLFSIDAVHNVAHLIFGAALIYGGMSGQLLQPIARTLFVVFVVLLAANFIQPLVDLLALNWWDFALHLGSAAITGYLGFVAERQVSAMRPS